MGECYHIRDMSFEKVKTGGQFISVRAPFISVAWETRKMGFGFSRTVLLHEMIHLHNQSADHGDDFDRERRRLMQYREIREILI